jgi:hypothetical protein
LTHGQAGTKLQLETSPPHRSCSCKLIGQRHTNCTRVTTRKGVEPPLSHCAVLVQSPRVNWVQHCRTGDGTWGLCPPGGAAVIHRPMPTRPTVTLIVSALSCHNRRSTPMDVIQRQRIEGFVSRMMASLILAINTETPLQCLRS